MLVSIVFISCGSDDDDDNSENDCQTCAAFEFEVNGETQINPAQEVCRDENGNALVNGSPGTLSFEDYIEGAELFTECN